MSRYDLRIDTVHVYEMCEITELKLHGEERSNNIVVHNSWGNNALSNTHMATTDGILYCDK